MMSMIQNCPGCGRKLRVAEGLAAGARCPTCGETFAPTGETADEPPWQRAGAIRRDCLPHRGGLILGLGVAGLVGSTHPALAWAGLPLSLTALVMGRHDLRRMSEQLIDPNGRGATNVGTICATIGTVIGGIWLLVAGLFVWLLFAR